MINLRMESVDAKDYAPVHKLFMESGLEDSDEKPVETNMIHCWRVVHGEEKHMAGAVVLSKRQGEYIIDGIAVEKIYRKLQIGKLMMDKAVEEVRELGGTKLFLVARAPGFFKTLGFKSIEQDRAPLFFECGTCPQFGVDCHPEIMVLEVE